MKTKGQLEAEISEAIIKFEQECMGRGPEETKTYILDDMVLVRLQGVLTPAEKQFANADECTSSAKVGQFVRVERSIYGLGLP